jgi:hypothetical protein
MTDYKWVTFTDNLNLAMGSDLRRTIKADDKISLRKATDARAPGKGVEIVRKRPEGGEDVEFVGMERVTSVIYADKVEEVAVTKASK